MDWPHPGERVALPVTTRAALLESVGETDRGLLPAQQER